MLRDLDWVRNRLRQSVGAWPDRVERLNAFAFELAGAYRPAAEAARPAGFPAKPGG